LFFQRARNKLRRAIETIDSTGIVEGMSEIRGLQQHYPQFADMEMRAGKSMLDMLNFESQLSPGGVFSLQGQSRLSDEVLILCHEICSCADVNKRKTLQRRLFKLAASSDKYEYFIRSYKWSKIYCTWKYPEIVGRNVSSPNPQTEHEDDMGGDFFGLKPAEARASKYIIRSLHQDVDCILGGAPASIQAALGLFCCLFTHL
jgi:hypothetical protein